jgi:hypothetical protein
MIDATYDVMKSHQIKTRSLVLGTRAETMPSGKFRGASCRGARDARENDRKKPLARRIYLIPQPSHAHTPFSAFKFAHDARISSKSVLPIYLFLTLTTATPKESFERLALYRVATCYFPPISPTPDNYRDENFKDSASRYYRSSISAYEADTDKSPSLVCHGLKTFRRPRFLEQCH